MPEIFITIREKDKGSKNLSFLNLREETVSYLYKDTIAYSTKADQQFLVLYYFANITVGNKSFIEAMLDVALPRFDNLIQSFSQVHRYLNRNEYSQLVNEYGLKDFFYKDIFFVVSEAVINIENIESKYRDVLNDNEYLKEVFQRLKINYIDRLRSSIELFSGSKIRDDRTDEAGNYHDLSKSVYRTIQMRNSRNLELNLQKYTSIKSITSRSPIVVDFVQSIDPQMIFDLWDKYHVTEYVRGVWHFLNSSLVSGVIGGLIVQKYTV